MTISPDVAPEDIGATILTGREGLPKFPEYEAITAEVEESGA